MSISSCFNKTVLSGLYIYPIQHGRSCCKHYIYIIIFRNVLYAHMFLIESQLRVHTVKGQTAGKGKLISYIRQ